jgi:hypothetical protein
MARQAASGQEFEVTHTLFSNTQYGPYCVFENAHADPASGVVLVREWKWGEWEMSSHLPLLSLSASQPCHCWWCRDTGESEIDKQLATAAREREKKWGDEKGLLTCRFSLSLCFSASSLLDLYLDNISGGAVVLARDGEA